MTVYDNIVRMWYIWYFTCIVNGNLFLLGVYFWSIFWISSVKFSRSVVSSSLQPQGLQHSRPSCPSPTHRASSNSCPMSWWCHPNISSSVISFFPCLQSFPASGSFPVSWSFTFFGIAFFSDWNENWRFLVLWPLLSFLNLLAYRVQHFNSIIF